MSDETRKAGLVDRLRRYLLVPLLTISSIQLVAAKPTSYDSLDDDSLLSAPSSFSASWGCNSCASFAYLPLWQDLMHHYFPPRNFTDRCWAPDRSIATGFPHPMRKDSEKISVGCESACFTIRETIDQNYFAGEQAGVLRGCVDRLLLFGIDPDVREHLAAPSRQAGRLCRVVDRAILRMTALASHAQTVTLCTCVGERCNSEDMLADGGSGAPTFDILTLLLSILTTTMITVARAY